MLLEYVYGGVECRFHWQLASVVESVPQSSYKLSGFISVHGLFLFYISVLIYIYIYTTCGTPPPPHTHTPYRDPRTHIYIYTLARLILIVWCDTISIKFYIYCCCF